MIYLRRLSLCVLAVAAVSYFLISRLVHSDIALSLKPVEGLDVSAYADAVLDRFRNPKIRHLLSQIAWDGSQKLPYRLLDTIQDELDAGRNVDRLAVPVAASVKIVVRELTEGRRARLAALEGEPAASPVADDARPPAHGEDPLSRSGA